MYLQGWMEEGEPCRYAGTLVRRWGWRWRCLLIPYCTIQGCMYIPTLHTPDTIHRCRGHMYAYERAWLGKNQPLVNVLAISTPLVMICSYWIMTGGNSFPCISIHYSFVSIRCLCLWVLLFSSSSPSPFFVFLLRYFKPPMSPPNLTKDMLYVVV